MEPEGAKGKQLLEGIETRARRRSQRVMLQMAVQIHLHMVDGRLLRQEAFTQVVNAHGGLLEMETRPAAGQRMLLMNPTSGAQQSATILSSKRAREGGYAVAFEFDSPAPKLWSLAFPPDDWRAEPA
jgi:hypothetical protein